MWICELLCLCSSVKSPVMKCWRIIAACVLLGWMWRMYFWRAWFYVARSRLYATSVLNWNAFFRHAFDGVTAQDCNFVVGFWYPALVHATAVRFCYGYRLKLVLGYAGLIEGRLVFCLAVLSIRYPDRIIKCSSRLASMPWIFIFLK